jgi:hypothetical protein
MEVGGNIERGRKEVRKYKGSRSNGGQRNIGSGVMESKKNIKLEGWRPGRIREVGGMEARKKKGSRKDGGTRK